MASWTSLPVELKQEIVDYLYYTDKQSLSQCSKSDRALVAKCRWVFDRIEYWIHRDDQKMVLEHRYRRFCFGDSKIDDGTIVEVYQRFEEAGEENWSLKSKNTVVKRDFEDLAGEKLNEVLKAQNYKIRDFRLNLNTKVPVFNRPISVKQLDLTLEVPGVSIPEFFQMINSFKPNIDFLEIRLGFEIAGMGKLEAVRKAKRLTISGISGLDEDDLVELEAKRLDVYSMDVSRKAMGKFLNKRYDMEIECQFDVNAIGEEQVEEGFECVKVEEEEDAVLAVSGAWKLKKPGSKMTCYLVDLDQSNVQGRIFKTKEG